jgi:hypothetical protein
VPARVFYRRAKQDSGRLNARLWSKPRSSSNQIVTLPTTTALRREQIKLKIGLITALMHVKGYAAPETKAAEERARLLIEMTQLAATLATQTI